MNIPANAPPEIQQALRDIHAELRRLGSSTLNVDHSGKRTINAGDALADQDYVTLRQLKVAVGAAVETVKASTTGTDTSGTGTGTGSGPFTDTGQGELGCGEAGATGHVSAALPLDAETAGKIICGTGDEFPALKAITADQPTRDANRDQLLDRMVWHMNLAGYRCSRYPTTNGRPWILLFNIPVLAGPVQVAYRVAGYETFETEMTTVMVFGGSSAVDTPPDAGIAD